MKKRIKIFSVLTIVVLMAAYTVYSALQPMAVETEVLSLKESEITFVESGVIVDMGERVIYPMVPGEVSTIEVKEGDRVSAGDILATLDSAGIDLQVEQATSVLEGYEAQMAAAQVEYDVTIANLKGTRSSLYGQLYALNAQAGTEEQRSLEVSLVEQSLALYEQALENLEKNKELLRIGVITDSEYEAVENLVAQYEVNYLQSQITQSGSDDVYQGNKRSLNGQIAAINAALDADTLSHTLAYYESMIDGAKAALKALEVQASYYEITSPIDGVVNSVSIEKLGSLTGMEEAFIIQGEGEKHVEVSVSTRDIGEVTIGDEVRLILDQRSGDETTLGHVDYIASNAVTEISPLGIEERKVPVFIQLEAPSGYGANYEVDVEFIVYSGGEQVAVPNSALYTVDGQDTVMVIRNGKATEQAVILGYELIGETIVQEGLEAGDELIVDLDAKGLSVGKRVTSSMD